MCLGHLHLLQGSSASILPDVFFAVKQPLWEGVGKIGKVIRDEGDNNNEEDEVKEEEKDIEKENKNDGGKKKRKNEKEEEEVLVEDVRVKKITLTLYQKSTRLQAQIHRKSSLEVCISR
tara:strand:- start:98 stop:454 length:357 start_codon:yes stop_codon:yes gene_type:complete